ncbi:MAG: hypothetical protein AAGF14_08985, partial [Pseudomonadota bacterium]
PQRRRSALSPEEVARIETPDGADDMNRLFPAVGEAFEQTGAVSFGIVGDASCRLCDFLDLIGFASAWIGDANGRSGALF